MGKYFGRFWRYFPTFCLSRWTLFLTYIYHIAAVSHNWSPRRSAGRSRSSCVRRYSWARGRSRCSDFIRNILYHYYFSQVKDFVKYCMNDDATSSERLNEVVVNPRGIVLDGDIDFSQIERLRRPKKSPPSIKSGRTNQLSNRDRLLRFHQTNWC